MNYQTSREQSKGLQISLSSKYSQISDLQNNK